MKPFLSFLLTCFLTFSLIAQDSTKEDFIPLFNGENLEGWTASKEKPESFYVEDGALVCKGGRAHLFYTGEVGGANFKNFEYKLKVKTTAGSNSGVYFHTQYQEKGWPDAGFEAQVNSTHTDPRKTGSLYGIVNWWVPGEDAEPFTIKVDKKKEIFAYQKKAPSTDNEWFDYHIIVIDNHVTIKVNGMTVVDWTQPEDWDRKARKIAPGTMALQAHDPKSEVHYKDIHIKILD